jgi:hypothetical protein
VRFGRTLGEVDFASLEAQLKASADLDAAANGDYPL